MGVLFALTALKLDRLISVSVAVAVGPIRHGLPDLPTSPSARVLLTIMRSILGVVVAGGFVLRIPGRVLVV